MDGEIKNAVIYNKSISAFWVHCWLNDNNTRSGSDRPNASVKPVVNYNFHFSLLEFKQILQQLDNVIMYFHRQLNELKSSFKSRFKYSFFLIWVMLPKIPPPPWCF